jgi:hypothetical protein
MAPPPINPPIRPSFLTVGSPCGAWGGAVDAAQSISQELSVDEVCLGKDCVAEAAAPAMPITAVSIGSILTAYIGMANLSNSKRL